MKHRKYPWQRLCLGAALLGGFAWPRTVQAAAQSLPITGETGGGAGIYVLIGVGVALCVGAAIFLVRGKKRP